MLKLEFAVALARHGLQVFPVNGLPEVGKGADLAALIQNAISRSEIELLESDVLVVAQKIVSKAEGAVVDLSTVDPGPEAIGLAETVQKDARLVELILSQSRRIVRSVPGVLITETHHGLVCANAGIDASNSPGPEIVILLPEDPDRSARTLRDTLRKLTGVSVAVVISDTFNRPWRQGSVNVGIGTAGFEPLDDSRGLPDDAGRILRSTLVSAADEIASAAQLVMGESGGIPAAIVRGLRLLESESGSDALIREPERDLFR